MKCCLALLIALTSYSLAQAQNEVRCKLLDIAASDWNNTVSLGTCSTSPQLCDEYGNSFRYRAKVRDEKSEQINRWAWDVFLLPR